MEKVLQNIRCIAFDADDTLWTNEPYFRKAEEQYCALLQRFALPQEIISLLYSIEMKNLAPYGYGAKAFTLSLMETAITLDKKSNAAPLTSSEMEQIINIGTSLINIPIEILSGVEQLLQQLHSSGKYTIVLATKGDLLDQQRKLERSSLAKYFHHTEVMSNKGEKEYNLLLKRLCFKSNEFLMIGNSMKSDILPVINIGGYAVYIPFYSTWEHEKINGEILHPRLYECKSCQHLLEKISCII